MRWLGIWTFVASDRNISCRRKNKRGTRCGFKPLTLSNCSTYVYPAGLDSSVPTCDWVRFRLLLRDSLRKLLRSVIQLLISAQQSLFTLVTLSWNYTTANVNCTSQLCHFRLKSRSAGVQPRFGICVTDHDVWHLVSTLHWEEFQFWLQM